MSHELGACRGCGKWTWLVIYGDRVGRRPVEFVQCVKCKVNGPYGFSTKEAVKKWNASPLSRRVRKVAA